MPIHYGTSTSSTMDPETVVRIILTVAEHSMSESSESSESPFTDEDDTLKRMGWEDAHAKKPCWALLSGTYYAAETAASNRTSGVRTDPTLPALQSLMQLPSTKLHSNSQALRSPTGATLSCFTSMVSLMTNLVINYSLPNKRGASALLSSLWKPNSMGESWNPVCLVG